MSVPTIPPTDNVTWLWSYSPHKGSALLVLLAIAHKEQEGTRYITLADIGDDTRLGERAVRYILRVLEATEAITVTRELTYPFRGCYQIKRDRARIRVRRSAKAKARISPSLRRSVYERDRYRCQECGTHLQLSVDHIIPESLGGSTEFENLRTLCVPCNARKGARHDG